MRKIAIIGGGSAKFVRELVVDFFSYEELRELEISLMDIDAERVARSERMINKIIRDRKLPSRVSATTDRRQALEGADYVIVTIMVGGLKHYQSDVAIPAKYGVLQTVSDTIGPGGVFRCVRTAPVLRGLASDLREVAPCAWLLNYANPMAMNLWTLLDSGHERSVGLCHSIQNTYPQIARWIGIPPDEVRYTAGGLNHVNFYLTLEHKGRNIYPDLLAAKDRVVTAEPWERPRFELLEAIGYFPAEGPQHQTEYYPWFRKDETVAKQYACETYWGYDRDSANYKARVSEVDRQITGKEPIVYERSNEYGARILHSLETGRPRVFYGNIRNHGLIENLPPQAVVETPCLADANGITPCRVGQLPAALAALMTPHVAVHGMAVEGALTKSRRLVRQAIQADPLTGAILTLPQIRAMTDELFLENAEYTSDWATD
ncbi:MAG: alpha-galactosidase [bacterium]|jgi:alpha-galactosidase